jgi:hypothetical protein
VHTGSETSGGCKGSFHYTICHVITSSLCLHHLSVLWVIKIVHVFLTNHHSIWGLDAFDLDDIHMDEDEDPLGTIDPCGFSEPS